MTIQLLQLKLGNHKFSSVTYAIGNNYHTDMTGPMEGLDYNMTLYDELRAFIDYCGNNSIPLIELKGDYLAERSVEDNIILET